MNTSGELALTMLQKVHSLIMSSETPTKAKKTLVLCLWLPKELPEKQLNPESLMVHTCPIRDYDLYIVVRFPSATLCITPAKV